MRGSFLLLLHATSLFGATLLDQMEVSAPECRTPGCDRVIVAWGKNLTRPSSLGGIFDLTSPPTSIAQLPTASVEVLKNVEQRFAARSSGVVMVASSVLILVTRRSCGSPFANEMQKIKKTIHVQSVMHHNNYICCSLFNISRVYNNCCSFFALICTPSIQGVPKKCTKGYLPIK